MKTRRPFEIGDFVRYYWSRRRDSFIDGPIRDIVSDQELDIVCYRIWPTYARYKNARIAPPAEIKVPIWEGLPESGELYDASILQIRRHVSPSRFVTPQEILEATGLRPERLLGALAAMELRGEIQLQKKGDGEVVCRLRCRG